MQIRKGEPFVSISGEKPIPWRQLDTASGSLTILVSISGEKPIPWRRRSRRNHIDREKVSISGEKPIPWRPDVVRGCPTKVYVFQSQARSQSPGDEADVYIVLATDAVSISGEKPIPWRRGHSSPPLVLQCSFNLRREANPLATRMLIVRHARAGLFQSQARSQSPGDPTQSRPVSRHDRVSISGEKPIPWRRASSAAGEQDPHSFNLRREANPLATR